MFWIKKCLLVFIKKFKMFKKKITSLLLLVFLLFIVIFTLRFVLTKNERQPTEFLKGFVSNNLLSPTPTPFPFQELTIPYLRSLNYQSSLGELAKISEKNNYISYLTSYTSEGLQVNGLLTIPKGQKPENGWPAIVFVHGYIAPDLYQTTSNYLSYVDYLAKSNFVVFKIDLRGHHKSEGEPGGAYYSSDYVIDTLSAFEALKASDFVDPERIGLWGHSMGGNVVFRSFVIKNIPAIVIWSGAVYSYEDMSKYGINDNSYRPPSENTERRRYREELRRIYGDFNPDNPFWQQVAPTNYLDNVSGTIQIHHALNDSVVDIGYSRDLINLLETTNIIHELREYSSGGHNIEGNSFTQAMQSTVEFFQENLDK